MKRLEHEIRKELDRFGPADAAIGGKLVAIVRAWPTVVGEENARRSWPSRLTRDGTLVVHATDSVWAFQLGMLAGDVLERLRAELGEAAPAALRFVPGPVPAAAAAPTEERASTLPRVAPEDAVAASELAAEIEDDELRAIVARAAAASFARGRDKPRSDRGF